MIRWKLAAVVLPIAACTAGPPDGDRDEWDDKLADRVVDYSAALRIAALRLTGDLPTLAQIHAVADAPAESRGAVYAEQIEAYLAAPEFARQMVVFWRDTLRLGGTPDVDTAPVFMARLAVTNGDFTKAFTAFADTCPTFDPVTATFTAGDCPNHPAQRAGILTDPGMLRMNFSNFAFRRVRWVQETFACTRFPAEIALTPTDVGGLEPYTGMFPFDSIAGGRVDFTDTRSVICANCHSNLNHIAPLFARFDFSGEYHEPAGVDGDELSVPTTLPGNPPAKLTDYLPTGERLGWRHDAPVDTMYDLGRAIAADPDVAQCVVARLWNWALGKGDIVDTMTTVPATTIATQVDAFTTGGYRLRDAIYRVYTSDDFIKF